ncbi:MAG: hypothetical protein GX674_12925, partial [Clostridiales bacterium]|nr:hypothetical protein [Clostridiales bacterium]
MLLSLAVSALAGLTGMLISPGTAKAGTLLFEAIPLVTATPKPVIPDGGGEENLHQGTHRPVDKPTDKPTNKQSSGGGKYMTSEGPLFLSFRQDLTDEYYMFTPMDLRMDNEYHFPRSAAHARWW